MSRNRSSGFYIILIALFLTALNTSIAGATANKERRVALVVGNWSYSAYPLVNPKYDAEEVAASLHQLGFKVLLRTNLDQQSFKSAIQEFGDQMKDGGVGLFFYAGHGLQFNGRNYLVPIKANINDEKEIVAESVEADLLLQEMASVDNLLNIIILDACRNNPFATTTRGFGGAVKSAVGLAQMDAPSGSLISYSTSPGATASDGHGRNSPFVKNLLINMKYPGLTIEQVLKRVRVGVEKITDGAQTPWEVSSLKGEFYFLPVNTTIPLAPSAPVSEAYGKLMPELAYWTTIQESDDPVLFRLFIEKFPDGRFIDLAKWKINKLPNVAREQKTDVARELINAEKELLILAADKNMGNNAELLFGGIVKTHSGNVRAQLGQAYTYLKLGKLEAAEESFKNIMASPEKLLKIQGQEGLARVKFLSGNYAEALQHADSVLSAAPNRTMALLVKGSVLFKRGKGAEAKQLLRLAVAKSSVSDYSWQKSDAHMALGNLHFKESDFKMAQQSFKGAVIENPFSPQALSNQGVAFQKLADPKTALKVFNNLKQVSPSDRLLGALMAQAKRSLAQKADLERQKYIDLTVKDLVKRFKSQKSKQKVGDEWTSPFGALSILNFNNNMASSLSGRVGIENILKDELTRELALKNVSVVDRDVLDKTLAELKLGSSELANKKNRTKLGKITAAHVLATGSFFDSDEQSLVTMRLVETETTDIFLSLTHKSDTGIDPSRLASQWADKIAGQMNASFPLQGRIVKVKPKQVIVNIGSRNALKKGTVFNVLSEGEPIDLGDGEVEYDYDIVGKIKIVKVKKKIAYGEILPQSGTMIKNQKIVISQ